MRKPRAHTAVSILAGGIFALSAALSSTHAAPEPPRLAQARKALAEDLAPVAIQLLKNEVTSLTFPSEHLAAACRILAEAQVASDAPVEALQTLSALPEPVDDNTALLRAHCHAAQGNWSEALAIYHRLNGRVDSPSAALGEAESLQALGRTREALPLLEKLVNSGKAGISARLRFASLLVEADRPSDARKVLAETKPTSAGDRKWGTYIQARILLAEGDKKGAARLLEALLEPGASGKPDGVSGNLSAAATLALAEASLLPGNPDAAVKVLERFIRRNPSSAHLEIVFRRLDQLYSLDRSPQEGVMQGFVKDLGPRVAALARFYIARMQMRERNYVKANGSIRQFLAKFPEHPLVPFMHAMRAEMELAGVSAATEPAAIASGLKNAEAAFDAAARASASDELKAEFAMRTALINIRQRGFVQAANHLNTAKKSPRLRAAAEYNGALAWLMQENHERFEREFTAYLANDPPAAQAGALRLEQGLVKARADEPDAQASLIHFLQVYPWHPRRSEAQLALAELSFAENRLPETSYYIQASERSPHTPEIASHAEYLKFFVEDARQPRNDEQVISLGRAFIEKYGQSKQPADAGNVADVRMKLGQVYFEREDFLNAQEQFETVANSQPDGTFAETALFLAGQCGTKLFTAEAHKHAMELFDKVAAMKGTMAPYARLQQAILKSQLGAEDDAVKIYESVLAGTVPADVRFASLIGKGDNLAALARKDAKQEALAASAITAYDLVASAPNATASWRNQAAYKKAKVLRQLGRDGDALVELNSILDKNSGAGAERETFWFSRAGFDAAAILEAQQQWKSAIGIYRKMAKIPGPHVSRAQQRTKALQLEHFLMD